MARPWLSKALKRITRLASERKVDFTLKAFRELVALGRDPDDACEVLGELTAADFVERQESVVTGEWLYVFKPEFAGILL